MPSVEGIPAKYMPLYRFLVRKGREGQNRWQTTFEDVETIIGASLPNSARSQSLFWENLRQRLDVHLQLGIGQAGKQLMWTYSLKPCLSTLSQ